jgi:hypothetical protein
MVGILGRVAEVMPRLGFWFCVLWLAGLGINSIAGLVWAPTGFAHGDELPSTTWPLLLEVNDWHQIFHLITLIPLTLALVRREWMAQGIVAFGLLYLLPTPFVALDGDDLANYVYMSPLDNVLHAAIGLQALAVGAAVRAYSPERA